MKPLSSRGAEALGSLARPDALRLTALHHRRVDSVHLGQDLDGGEYLYRVRLCDVELTHQLDEAQARLQRQRRSPTSPPEQRQMDQVTVLLRQAGLNQARYKRRDVAFDKPYPLRIG